MDYKKFIRDVIDFPHEGINYKDITPLLNNSIVFSQIIDDLAEKMGSADIILGLDARGFIFGGALAYKLNKPFVIVRKAGKLPHKTISVDYELEYGKNTFELHIDAFKKGDKIAIIDDLLATGGTAKAACQLVEKLGGVVDSVNFVINLPFLNGENILKEYKLNSLVNY